MLVAAMMGAVNWVSLSGSATMELPSATSGPAERYETALFHYILLIPYLLFIVAASHSRSLLLVVPLALPFFTLKCYRPCSETLNFTLSRSLRLFCSSDICPA